MFFDDLPLTFKGNVTLVHLGVGSAHLRLFGSACPCPGAGLDWMSLTNLLCKRVNYVSLTLAVRTAIRGPRNKNETCIRDLTWQTAGIYLKI